MSGIKHGINPMADLLYIFRDWRARPQNSEGKTPRRKELEAHDLQDMPMKGTRRSNGMNDKERYAKDRVENFSLELQQKVSGPTCS